MQQRRELPVKLIIWMRTLSLHPAGRAKLQQDSPFYLGPGEASGVENKKAARHHTRYLLFLLHRQHFQIQNFTPENLLKTLKNVAEK